MTITKTLNDTELTIAVAGRLDTTTAPDLEKEVAASMDGLTKLVFDFTELEYISSAGLRVLLSAQKVSNAKEIAMVLTGVNETVTEIFEITGFIDILTIV